jgi:DNA polymerase-1
MDKIYIVDAVNILFRSYYAIGPMTNPKGESTNALYGFIRSIQKMLKDFSPQHFIAVFDGPQSKEKRTKIYADYKSHRAAMPGDLVLQLERAIKFCEYAHIPHLSIPGVEADDTIGCIALWAEKKGAHVYICSSDKDLCQLVSPKISVIHVHKDNLEIDPKKVKELFGVEPSQIVDYLAIIGDASDNIPGLEGFGPKTAAALLEEFGTLDALLAHPEKVSGAKKQETLRQGKEIALMSRNLASLDMTVDFPQKEDFFKLKAPDLEPLKAFYLEMNFLSLMRDLGEEKTQETLPHAKEEVVEYLLVEDEAELDKLIEKLSQEKEICVDTETSDLSPLRAKMVGVGFCVDPKKAWYVPTNGKIPKEVVLKKIKPLLENPKIHFYGHNLKYDLHVFKNEGIDLQCISFDTLLASYLLTPQNPRHNLDELALAKFGKVKIPIEELIGKGKKQIGMEEVPIEKVKDYCAEDVDYTCRLKRLFLKDMEKQNVKEVFDKIELPLLPVLARMERHGIFVDTEKLKKMSDELFKLIESLMQEIYQMAGETFNISSPKQLSQILFEKMGIKPIKKTTTGFSTSAEVLETLQEEVPLVRAILEFRTLEKLRSTYVDALPLQINPQTQRIHCNFNQSVTATGRLSSQNPNLQNIPIRTEEGRRIREAFCPQFPNFSFVAADYSQIELRLLAHLSEDPTLMKAFKEGEDVHAYTASLVFDTPLKEVTQDMRRKAKAVNFGIIYGQQAFGLSEGLGIHYHEAAVFIETYFQRYKKIKEFLEFCKESVRKTGRAITMTGRQRPIPEILSKNPMIRAAAERLAINTPLQGSAADLIKIAMIEIDTLLLKEKNLGAMILQIHDELVFEVPDSQVDHTAKHVKKIMESSFHLKVPLIVDISIGKNWGEC